MRHTRATRAANPAKRVISKAKSAAMFGRAAGHAIRALRWGVCLSLPFSVEALGARLESDSLLISSFAEIHEYAPDGMLRQSIPVPWHSPGLRPTSENVRRAVVGDDSRVYVFNGTGNPSLSEWDLPSNTWRHTLQAGWNVQGNLSYGGIGLAADRVFVTDMETPTPTGMPEGIVYFDRPATNGARILDNQSFINLTVGLDGLLYALWTNETTVSVIDPQTLTALYGINLGASLRGIAVDADGTIFGASWDRNVYRLGRDGSVISSISGFANRPNLTDITLAPDGRIAVASRSGQILITDRDFNSRFEFDTGIIGPFVGWVPEPSGPIAFLTTILFIRRR